MKKKIAIPLGMKAGEWEGGTQQFNSAESGGCGARIVTSGDQEKRMG